MSKTINKLTLKGNVFYFTVLTDLMFCSTCIAIYQYSTTNKTHFFSVSYELIASTCFKHYFLIIWRYCIYNNWYTARVLCQLAATRVGTPTLVAASRQNTHKIIPNDVYTVPLDDEQIVLETCRGCNSL
jgi:hypothetical protein